MTEKAILEALQKAVIAAVADSTAPTTQVKYIGRNFTPPIDSTWLELIHIPNNVTGEFLSSGRTYMGLFRLLFHYPMKDEGAYNALTLADSISSYFYKGRRLSDAGSTVSVIITDHPNLLSLIEEPPEMLMPISIRYSFFKSS